MAAKIRRDSKLKSLPLVQQDAVIQVAKDAGITKAALARIQTDLGIEVRSLKTLSEFWHWWHEPQQRISREIETAGSVTALVVEKLRASQPQFTEEELFAFGQRVFAERAIALQDTEAWVKTQAASRDKERVALKGQEVDLARSKYQRETAGAFLDWADNEEARAIAKSGDNRADKIEKLGQLMFGEGWR
jgi:hypothetical protein